MKQLVDYMLFFEFLVEMYLKIHNCRMQLWQVWFEILVHKESKTSP